MSTRRDGVAHAATALAVAGWLAGCGQTAIELDGGGVGGHGGSPDANSLTCTPCLETRECGAGAACVESRMRGLRVASVDTGDASAVVTLVFSP